MTDKGKRGKINEILQYQEDIAMASKVLINISKDEIEQERLMSELKYELDTQSKLVHAERKGKQEIINQLKNGKSPEEIIRDFTEEKQS